MRHTIAGLALGLLLSATASCARSPLMAGTAPGPVRESRIYDVRAKRDVDFAAVAERAARSDLVFFGEQHDDAATHRAELALLAAIGARRPNVVLSLEMFERDVQPVLDSYLAGQIPESLFLARTRPWPRYSTDYRALVELARAHGWPVVASNVPRRIASAVSRAGITVLDTMSATDRSLVASDISCPRDRYFDRFAESMRGHSAGAGPGSASDSAAAAAMTARFYQAQCVKDETMGESIAAAFNKAGAGAIVVHVNGSFHSDMGLGAAERALRRLPGVRSIVVSAVPVDDPGTADVLTLAERGDYIVLTRKPPGR